METPVSADRQGTDPHHPRPERRRAPREDLAGTGRTALPPDLALRARDLDRPTAEDLAAAEAELTIVRRHWTPPA